MTSPTFRQLLAAEAPLVLPGAYDALSARLIERAGFKAYVIGGFSVVGARHAVPDIGLMGLGEISAGVRDIVAASPLPVVVDADTGYGDVKNVVHTVRTYERLGAAALILEDQVAPKRCGHMAGKAVVPAAHMEAKLRAAVAGREHAETFIIARTDARSVHGLDEALSRGERYLAAGADGVFVEAPESLDELERVGRAFDAPNLANMLSGGKTPRLRPAELAALGFDMVVYGIDPLLHAARAVRDALAAIHRDPLALDNGALGFDEFQELVGIADWAGIEDRFGD
jgi:2-methylisocitrate lyase-like PEP mutase family enzyme